MNSHEQLPEDFYESIEKRLGKLEEKIALHQYMLKRFQTQTSHIVCAKCGSENSIKNNRLNKNLKIRKLTSTYSVIEFHCENCRSDYDLAVIENC